MGNLEYYEKKLGIIRAIDESRIKRPHHIPVEVYIQEADFLYLWALEDKEALTAAGLDWKLVEDLPIRCGALIEAEARWQTQRNTRKKSSLEWEKKYPIAHDLRKRLLTGFRFAFREHPTLMATVSNISKGKRHSKMIQDLNDLGVLGHANHQLLQSIDFDMSLLDKAAPIAKEMAGLLADTTRDRLEPGTAKIIRDQAYSHLKEAVDKIRSYGQYVFRQNKDRAPGYRSQYIRKIKSRKSRKNKEKPHKKD